MSAIIEKSIIFVSLLAAFPLFFLDKEILGFRRFAWLIAMSVGLVGNFVVDSTDELKDSLDKVAMAAISVTAVPHFMKLFKDSPWFGAATIPPIFVVIHLSIGTPVESENYWQLRAFLHMAVFILPYLNHLPSEKQSPKEEEVIEETPAEEIRPETKEKTPVKSKKTAKHKR